jgi:DNA-binding response OmpR family regulator
MSSTRMSAADIIAEQAAEISRLKSLIAELVGVNELAALQRLLRQPSTPARLTAILKRRPGHVFSYNALHGLIYGDDPNGGPDQNILKVFMSRLRPEYLRLGIHVETVWGNGYVMDAASAARLDALLAEFRP